MDLEEYLHRLTGAAQVPPRDIDDWETLPIPEQVTETTTPRIFNSQQFRVLPATRPACVEVLANLLNNIIGQFGVQSSVLKPARSCVLVCDVMWCDVMWCGVM